MSEPRDPNAPSFEQLLRLRDQLPSMIKGLHKGKIGGSKAKGRGRKGNVVPLNAGATNSLDDLGEDPRPQFLKDKEARRVKEAEESLSGMKTLDDGDAGKTIN